MFVKTNNDFFNIIFNNPARRCSSNIDYFELTSKTILDSR